MDNDLLTPHPINKGRSDETPANLNGDGPINMGLAANRAADGYIPFLDRFKAWWNGEEPTALQTRETASSPTDVTVFADGADAAPSSPWTPDRLSVIDRLWGEAASHPGGAEYTVQLVRPFSLQPTMSVLDLSAGLAGETRAVSDEFDVWITAMEPDPDLAAAAQTYCTDKGVQKVSVSHYDPAGLALTGPKFDCIYMREQLCFLPDREAAFAAIAGALKPEGQIILTDYVTSADAGATALPNWHARHPTPDPLWTPPTYRKLLKDHSLDVRVFQDDSDALQSLILNGWAQFVDNLSRDVLTRPFVDAMIVEADRWLRTVRALEAKELRFLRLHAIARPKIV